MKKQAIKKPVKLRKRAGMKSIIHFKPHPGAHPDVPFNLPWECEEYVTARPRYWWR